MHLFALNSSKPGPSTPTLPHNCSFSFPPGLLQLQNLAASRQDEAIFAPDPALYILQGRKPDLEPAISPTIRRFSFIHVPTGALCGRVWPSAAVYLIAENCSQPRKEATLFQGRSTRYSTCIYLTFPVDFALPVICTISMSFRPSKGNCLYTCAFHDKRMCFFCIFLVLSKAC